MKKLIFLILALGILTTSQSFAQKTENNVVCFKSNMHCENCQSTITEYLKFEKGVKDLKVDHVTNTIMIEYKTDKNNDEKFAKAIEKKGYKANKISFEEYTKMVKEADPEKNSNKK